MHPPRESKWRRSVVSKANFPIHVVTGLWYTPAAESSALRRVVIWLVEWWAKKYEFWFAAGCILSWPRVYTLYIIVIQCASTTGSILFLANQKFGNFQKFNYYISKLRNSDQPIIFEIYWSTFKQPFPITTNIQTILYY